MSFADPEDGTPMRRDRDGSWIRDEPVGHRCARGWLGSDPEGRPIPCLTCKPHLARRSALPPDVELETVAPPTAGRSIG